MAKDNLPVYGLTSDGAKVVIREQALGFLTQLAGWGNFAKTAEDLLRSKALSLPADYRTPVRGGGMTAWRIAPDRVLIRSDAELDMVGSQEIAVLDLSQARVCLVVTGAGAAALLARVIALDFSEAGFPLGTFAQTALHHVGVLVERLGEDEFNVFIPSTWATSLTGLMVDHLTQAASIS